MSVHEFAELQAGLRDLHARNFLGGAALATLVRTRGPVFRRAGARMLVFGDGRIVRGLSAGCPEADIAARAREVIDDGQSRLLRYDREHGYDTLLELGCGGEMDVLLEPLSDARHLRFANAIAAALQERRHGLLATVYARNGRCLAHPQRLIVDNGEPFDELDDGALREQLRIKAPPRNAAAAHSEHITTAQAEYEVLLEALQPRLRVVVLGTSTTALALARLARNLGWEADVVDHREHAPDPVLPDGARLLRSEPEDLLRRLALDPQTAVVVMTHNLERDLACLRVLREQPLAYLGALGSRSRAVKMHAIAGSATRPLHAPAGLDIGSETPEEIALAIAAEIQGVVNGHRGGSLNESAGPIH